MIIWTAINSAAIALLMLALYLTIRQVGLLLTHLGPGGARPSDLGPRLGENISPYTASLVGAQDAGSARTLFIFATEFCPACAAVRDAAHTIAKHWAAAARVVMVYDALATASGAVNRTRGLVLTAHPTLRVQLDIRAVPYAVVTDANGVVLGHGLVNNASHLESLLEINSEKRSVSAPETADLTSVSANHPEGVRV